MVKLEFDPFEVMLTLPLTAPLVVGANVTENDVLCPAFNVSGNPRPLRLNPAPLADAAEIVRLDPPEFVRVSVKFVLLPTCTLPKDKLVGFADSVPCVTPVPESGMLKLEFDPFEVTLTFPLAVPLLVGENRTVNEVLCPALNVRGSVSPLMANPLPEAVAAEIVRLVPPELVSVPLNDFEVPTWMLPKLKLDGFDPS
jgi:hypothetical protein